MASKGRSGKQLHRNGSGTRLSAEVGPQQRARAVPLGTNVRGGTSGCTGHARRHRARVMEPGTGAGLDQVQDNTNHGLLGTGRHQGQQHRNNAQADERRQ